MRQDYWSLGVWGRIPVQMHWTVLLSFAWLYFIFWDLTAMLIGSVALAVLMAGLVGGYALSWRRRAGGWWPPFAIVAIVLIFGVEFGNQ